MDSLYLGLIMALVFLVVAISQVFSLQKEVKKLKSITSFLLKFISNGWEISMLLISKAFPSDLTVEKKNIFRDRNIKKIYKNLK